MVVVAPEISNSTEWFLLQRQGAPEYFPVGGRRRLQCGPGGARQAVQQFTKHPKMAVSWQGVSLDTCCHTHKIKKKW